MSFFKNININGKNFPLAVNQTGAGAPTATTPGVVGMFYMDENTGNVYKCTEATNGVYTWLPLDGDTATDSGQNPSQGTGLTTTEKNHLLTILDAVIVETSKQPVVAEALAALKQLWSGGEVYVSQIGTTLALENVTAVTSITQNGTVLALA